MPGSYQVTFGSVGGCPTAIAAEPTDHTPGHEAGQNPGQTHTTTTVTTLSATEPNNRTRLLLDHRSAQIRSRWKARERLYVDRRDCTELAMKVRARGRRGRRRTGATGVRSSCTARALPCRRGVGSIPAAVRVRPCVRHMADRPPRARPRRADGELRHRLHARRNAQRAVPTRLAGNA